MERSDIVRVWHGLRPGSRAAYGLALLLSTVALGALAVSSRLLHGGDLFLAFAAVVASAALGGTGPGLLAGAVSVLGLGLRTRGDLARLLGPALSAALVAWAAGSLRRRLFSIEQDRARSEAERDDLVRALSHDVRTPLNVVTSHAQLLLRGAREESPAARRGVAILAGARRIAAMVDDLVLAAQIEAGRFRLVRRPLDLPALAAENIERLRGAHPVNRVRLEAVAALPAVEGDPERLGRALRGMLLALLGPANGGEVRVGVGAEAGQAVLTLSSPDAVLPESDLPHLFERSFRAHAAPDTFDGLGLDLYLARRIAEAHGGTVSVDSAPGRGTTFRFAFGAGARG